MDLMLARAGQSHKYIIPGNANKAYGTSLHIPTSKSISSADIKYCTIFGAILLK